MLAHHDRRRVAVHCYSDAARPDAVTARIRENAEVWRDIAPLSDRAVADLVRNDDIDVLVDLTGHIGRNRMPVLARRPAPVQMTYVGYPGTTGLEAIDFRITDSLADPPGRAESWHVESLLRIPGCAWCYDPGPEDELPPLGPPPAASAGHVTFGSLNRLAKLTPTAVALWARVLDAVPGSRLLVLATGGEANVTARRVLEHGGVPGDRLTLVNRRPRRQFLELSARVDIALDTFPYHGMTTTCDLLWCGVPTVTLAGERSASRLGVSILACVGLSGLAVPSADDYVAAAARLASDLPALAELRRGLRERARRSPLADGARVARALEDAYAATVACACACAPG